MTHPLVIAACIFAAASVQSSTPARADAVDHTPCPDSSIRPTFANSPQAAAATLCMMNAVRASNGLHPLRWNTRLATAAWVHSFDMVRGTYFAHESPAGQTLMMRVTVSRYTAGVIDWSAAENLAIGGGLWATPLATMIGWMNSPEHLENLLAPDLVDVGIGIVPTSAEPNSGAVYTADFGVRRLEDPKRSRRPALARHRSAWRCGRRHCRPARRVHT